jgi:hypothetical protein
MRRTSWQVLTLALSLVLGLGTAAGAVTQIAISKLGPDPLLITPANPTDLDPIHFTVSGVATSFCPPLLFPLVFKGTDIVIEGQNPIYPVTPDCQGPWTQELSIPPLPPGAYTVEFVVGDDLLAAQTLVVTLAPPPPALLEVDPRLPTTNDRVVVSSILTTNCSTAFGLPVIDGDHIVLPVTLGTRQSCVGPTVGHPGQTTLGPLPAGAYIVELDVDGERAESQGITVTEPTTTLPLVDHRFAVTVDRSAPNGGGPAFAVPLTDESGYFWFFDATNVELTVKILDGRPINGHYWVFLASMTNLPYTVKIEDLASPLCGPGGAGCPVKTYTAVQGVNGNFIDLGSL